jgi:hypothetical protein
MTPTIQVTTIQQLYDKIRMGAILVVKRNSMVYPYVEGKLVGTIGSVEVSPNTTWRALEGGKMRRLDEYRNGKLVGWREKGFVDNTVEYWVLVQ